MIISAFMEDLILHFSWMEIERLVLAKLMSHDKWAIGGATNPSSCLPNGPWICWTFALVDMNLLCVWWKEKEEFWWVMREKMGKDEEQRGANKSACPLFGPTEWLLELQETRPSVKRWKTCFCMRFKEKPLFFWPPVIKWVIKFGRGHFLISGRRNHRRLKEMKGLLVFCWL